MQITDKAEAQAVAIYRLDEDVVPFVRKVEATISIWTGLDALVVEFPRGFDAMIDHVGEMYRLAGWTVEVKHLTSISKVTLS